MYQLHSWYRFQMALYLWCHIIEWFKVCIIYEIGNMYVYIIFVTLPSSNLDGRVIPRLTDLPNASRCALLYNLSAFIFSIIWSGLGLELINASATVALFDGSEDVIIPNTRFSNWRLAISSVVPRGKILAPEYVHKIREDCTICLWMFIHLIIIWLPGSCLLRKFLSLGGVSSRGINDKQSLAVLVVSMAS